ncbi:ABC transporter substrate-binding protein [Salinarimonas ramus]|uniref:ABC transporter substrate-binding protein n=1 Tax=Salinarimonas ramus TaxID=690164 RepID=A0A917V245_9HYPH|nr:ABC transporter substrate-binding protein [Salinarimonas ramus]GGK20869.1 ABC transporter substrate-binding protein [Salinarimonas ramus]
MDRRTFLKAGASAGVLAGIRPAPARAQGESVLRLAMTLSDIPQTTGMATQGAEGIRFITNTIYDGLLRWDLSQGETTAEMVPSLAESYEVDESGTVWTFRLRPGVVFHDGAPFTADDVVWNLEKLANRDAPQFDQAQANQAGNFLANIASYEKLDDLTVAITTTTPDSMFFYKVDRIGMSSRAHWEALGGDWAAFAAQPSGTGPFQLVDLVPRERAELVKNAAYWDPNRVPKVDRLVLYAMPDPTTRVAALLSGQVDWVEAPPPDTIPRIEQSGAQIVMNVYPHVWPFWLSFDEGSPFLDIDVRRAANLAIDREGIAQFLGGVARPAKGLVAETSPWFGSPTFDVRYDPEEARRLMAQAGYGPDNPCRIKLLTSQAGSGQMQPMPMSEICQENLNAVGFAVEVEVVDWEALRARRRARADGAENEGTFGLNNSWSFQDPDFGFMSAFMSNRAPPDGNNWGLYSDEKADELGRAAQMAFDPAERDAAIARLHEYLVDQSVWITVVHDMNPRALAANVTGFVAPQNWYVDLTSVSVTG